MTNIANASWLHDGQASPISDWSPWENRLNRVGKKHCLEAIADREGGTIDKWNNTAATKVSEGVRGGALRAGAEISLQAHRGDHGETGCSLAARGEPHGRGGGCLKKAANLWETHDREGSWKDLWPHMGTTPQQLMKNCTLWIRLRLEKFMEVDGLPHGRRPNAGAG